MSIKVAFVGAGEMALKVHYPSVARYRGARIVAVCDLDEKRRDEAAIRYEIPARYADCREMLDREPIDAVYAVMPPMYLKPIVLQCLAAGKHVFTEKPLGRDANEAREMAEAAAMCRCITAVGFNRRFSPVLVEARRRVEKHAAANTVMAEFHKDMKGNYYPESGIPIIRLDIIHAVDALRWIGGDVLECHSFVDKLYGEDWLNNFNAIVRFERGAVGVLSANRKNGNRYERFELHAAGASAYVHAPERADVFVSGAKEPLVLTGEALCGTADARVTYGYEGECFHFLDCVAKGCETAVSFADALKSQELAERIEKGSQHFVLSQRFS